MKIALVCDDLIQHGGHEKVILDIANTFPEAPLYTTLATEEWLNICKEKGITLKTSFMQNLPFKKALNRIYSVFLLHIFALESFVFDDYDVVLSLSSRFAHGVITKPQTKHICYMSTVGRMFWEPNNYFERESLGRSKFIKNIALTVLKFSLSYIRLWDKTVSNRVDAFIANSKTTQARIKKYYKRDSVIINPAINIKNITEISKKLDQVQNNKTIEPYFLVLSRLVPWKNIDLAINACANLGKNLKIIGIGPDLRRLKSIAKDSNNIEFLGYVSEEEKVMYLKNCIALINTQLEDFGIVPLEGMACGKPVIAFAKGGALETVVEGVTGEFFYKQDKNDMQPIVANFNPKNYSPNECIKQALRFDISVFDNKIRKYFQAVNIQ